MDETRFFETVLRCVADGVFTVDRDWRISSFNRAAERITADDNYVEFLTLPAYELID